MTTAVDLRAPLARYASLLHGPAGATHHVASPLGAWLLAALCAPVGSAELEEALGVDLASAQAVASALLDDPHPAVLSAAALWLAGPPTSATDAWLAALPTTVTTGPMPSQSLADAWADEHTLGLIKKMPLTLTPDTVLLLATALATKVSWVQPFTLAPSSRLGAASPWRGAVSQVLEMPGRGHEAFIVRVPALGDVAVHTAYAAEGLRVTSVIGPSGAEAVSVLGAAYEIAVAAATRGSLDRRSLFDLPLGEGPAWTLTEEPVQTAAGGGREEVHRVVLPAWSAESKHDLDRPELGIPAAATGAKRALGTPGARHSAAQSAMARYSRVGFEAAAVSSMAVAVGFPIPQDGLRRTAEVRFDRPYAVVAVADRPWQDGWQPNTSEGSAWLGLPVFSAWVSEPGEALS
ncbi:hypothetical protein SAMN05421812_114169 [Asanoa hainanensis]|uniref:Serpin (Serine protease inhibitor) n=1 Tax=Asanoa hainanensis TaxID=560556 RepID=A0A239P809_9ACTN|nr:hypothetical protein [Asanoa hainanensis]SNT62748.1 hypothetical protein SAMN05421812_114169 [Asanoa hainanensis]